MDTEILRRTLGKALTELNPTDVWPINLSQVLTNLGLGLSFEYRTGKPGAHLRLDDSPTIVIHRQTPHLFLSARERFSIAHELAHWVIWRSFGVLPSSLSEYWFHELVCNEFAAGLLLPKRARQQFLKENEALDPVVFPTSLSKRGGVSWEVAAKSLTAYDPATMAYLRLRQRVARDSFDSPSKQKLLNEFRVDCSSVSNGLGVYVAQAAILREPADLLQWMDSLQIGKPERKNVTVALGCLRMTDVPCSILRETRSWIICFRPSDRGVEIQPSRMQRYSNTSFSRSSTA